MSSDLNTNRYDRIIRRVGNMVGSGSRVSEVLSELFPTIDLENVPAELLILGGTRICMGGGFIAAASSVAPKFQLFNPPGSNVLITMTRIWFTVDAAVIHRWGRSNVSFANNIATAVFTDTRNPVTNLPVGQIHTANLAALASATNQVRMLGNTPANIENENGLCVLSPGFGFEIGSGSVNVNASCGFNWRERVAEQSELSI